MASSPALLATLALSLVRPIWLCRERAVLLLMTRPSRYTTTRRRTHFSACCSGTQRLRWSWLIASASCVLVESVYRSSWRDCLRRLSIGSRPHIHTLNSIATLLLPSRHERTCAGWHWWCRLWYRRSIGPLLPRYVFADETPHADDRQGDSMATREREYLEHVYCLLANAATSVRAQSAGQACGSLDALSSVLRYCDVAWQSRDIDCDSAIGSCVIVVVLLAYVLTAQEH